MSVPTSTYSDVTARLTHGATDRAEIIDLLCAYVSEALRSTEQWASAQGIHTTDARAMAALGQAQRTGAAMTAGELAAAIGLSSSATSALISRLEHAGHIERSRDPEDRRRVILTPTPSAGLSAIAYFQPMGDAVTAALSGYDTTDTAVIAGFLERLVSSMGTAPPP